MWDAVVAPVSAVVVMEGDCPFSAALTAVTGTQGTVPNTVESIVTTEMKTCKTRLEDCIL